MEYVTLKHSDIEVSRLCMGGCPMGQYGWGKVSEQELIDAVHVAIDGGITFFDTADTYGLGQSEITLGKSLKGLRQKVVIATKFGVRVENGKTFYDNSPDYIEKAVTSSLQRLHTDYIDLYQIHYRDGITPICDVIDELEKLKAKGYIRTYGLSNISDEDINELQRYAGQFSSLQDEYSLAHRGHEQDLINAAKRLDLTPMTWGSLGQGILTGKYSLESKFGEDDRRSRATYDNFHGEKLKKNLEIVEVMEPIAEKHKVSVSSVAIRFILDRIPESVVLVGVKRPDQITANIEAMDWSLSSEEMKVLDCSSR